jgi:hypothetical protein
MTVDINDSRSFWYIASGYMEDVQQIVLANPLVLEERSFSKQTPLIFACAACAERRVTCQPAIALWLIEHRGQHDVNAQDDEAMTAQHWA